LKTLGDSALHFELSYFAQRPSLNPLLDVQQAVNFRIIEEFRRTGVDFDYPTQRVILEPPRPTVDK
jgi:small-conductance mechanosensitive channel